MPRRNPEIIKRRNKAMKAYYDKLKEKNPEWRYDALLQHTADRFFLEQETVQKILIKMAEEASTQVPLFPVNGEEEE